ncbi:MAG TPA: MFS transporter [Gemmataceae bacterium]|nr:MFS transporter [Gemmataceae bacterium]
MSTVPSAAGATPPTRVRYVVLVLLALAPMSAYLTRGMGAFTTTLMEEFHVSSEVMGGVLAGFALGYFFQVPGGMLANAFGTRTVLSLIGLTWSVCALWGSKAQTPDELYWSRVGLGLAQGGLVPCCAKAVADWFPLARRGLVSAVLTGSMQLGGILALGLSASLLEVASWRLLVQCYAVFGIVWAVVFLLWFRNRPEEHGSVNAAERELIAAGRAPITAGTANEGATDWKRLTLAICLRGSLWAYFLQALFRAYGYEFFASWCPAYLEKAHGVGKTRAGQLGAWPIAAFGAGSLLGGLVVDALLTRTRNRWLSRCGSAILGLVVCAGCFALATLIEDVILVTVVLSVGCLFAALSGPATWAAGIDIGGRHTAVIFGVMNTIGNIGPYLSNQHVGSLFEHIKRSGASWDLVLWLFVGINAAAAVLWVFVDPRHSIEESTGAREERDSENHPH